MRFLRRLLGMVRVLGRARRNRGDLPGWLVRRPQLLVATVLGEMGIMASNRLPPRLRTLAEIRTAAMAACEFCLDIGAALAEAEGISEREVLELHRYETSDAFDDLDRLVLRFVDAVTATPAVVDPALRDELVDRLGRAGVAELAFAIAWENKRARLYLALGVRPAGFGDGLACAVPNRPAA